MAETTTMVFQNYVPLSENLRPFVKKLDGVPSREAEVQVAAAKQKARALPSGNAPPVVTAKKVTWDLKRDCEKRLKRLAKRTQLAIQELAEELYKNEEEAE